MRDIERPISPMRRGQSTSPMRVISTVSTQDIPTQPKQTPVQDPIPTQDPTPEYHPTPKQEKDMDYQAYRKEVEIAKATGAIQKYRIPRKSNCDNCDPAQKERNRDDH